MANAVTATTEPAPSGAGLRFSIGSRPMRRFSAAQTQNTLTSGSFQPISLPPTGYVRKIALYFSYTGTCASAGALVAGDGPWNMVSGITLQDATGQPIIQPLSGFNAYLVNKFLSMGTENSAVPSPWSNPHAGPDYAYAATATTFTASWRIDLDLEIDSSTGYGCVPNMDANASLGLKIDYAPYSVAFAGTGVATSALSVRVEQHYWAPVAGTVGGMAMQTSPPGLGDFLETRYETQTVTAGSENTVPFNSRGGLIKGVIMVSRNAGVRTAFTANSNVGLVYDNNAIDEGVTFESHSDLIRRTYGYLGTDLALSYAPLSAGVLPGLDRGVNVWNFGALSGNRDSWLSTRVGTYLQAKVTPGASATQVELITQLAQVRDAAAFYGA